MENSKELALRIVAILGEKKAHNVRLLHVENQTVLTDYLVICEGTSNTQIHALANEVEYVLGEEGVDLHGSDGMREATWVVLDYLHVMVHIFSREARAFYDLEKLWHDAEEEEIPAELLEK